MRRTQRFPVAMLLPLCFPLYAQPAVPGAGKPNATARTESPLAVIISCADIRVAPQVLFDIPASKLITFRVNGPILSKSQRQAAADAVVRSAAPLVVIVGHKECRVMQTAQAEVSRQSVKEFPRGRLRSLLEAGGPETGGRTFLAKLLRLQREELLDFDPRLARLARTGRLEIKNVLLDDATGEVQPLGSRE